MISYIEKKKKLEHHARLLVKEAINTVSFDGKAIMHLFFLLSFQPLFYERYFRFLVLIGARFPFYLFIHLYIYLFSLRRSSEQL